MNLNDYQSQTRQTAIYPNVGSNPFYPTFGLAGEAGEIAEKMVNYSFSSAERTELLKEIGDVLWYTARLADEFNLSLEDLNNTVSELKINSLPQAVFHLVGTVGKVSERVKKVIRDDNSIFTETKINLLTVDIQNVLMALKLLCKFVNADLLEIAQANLDKLFSRKERNTLSGSGDNR